MSVILHLMGPTCAGKSTLIRRLLQIAPEKVGAVEVGRMLREKYGESYFRGQAAPEHTQAEAWRMYVTGVQDTIEAGKQIVLVDGQPRDHRQAVDAVGMWKHPHHSSFLLIHASHEERERRARADRSGDSLDLALARLDNDYRNCYTVVTELLKRDVVVRVFDTSDSLDASTLAELVLAEYGW